MSVHSIKMEEGFRRMYIVARVEGIRSLSKMLGAIKDRVNMA